MAEGWISKPLSELAVFYSGGTPNKANPTYWGGSIPWVTVKDMKGIRLDGAIDTLTEQGADTVRVVPTGAVLVLVRGMGLFKDLPVVLCDAPVAFNQDIKALVPKKDVDNQFLAYALFARKGDILKHVETAGHGTGRLDTDLLKSTRVPLPPLPEQRKIAEILRTWDEAIEKLEVLWVAKQKRLEGLTHALIFGKLGMNGQRRSWQPMRLSEVTFELTARNTNLDMGRATVMAVTKARGVVPMREQTIGGDLSRYKRLPPRAFAYNPMRINVGSIAMNDRDEEFLVSPDYVVFGCTENGLAPDFLNHLRKTHWWSHHINIGGSGSVRMRTYYDDLAAMKLPLPPYREQLEIVAVLNTAQEDAKATEKASKALTCQKRGLMQKLLTGEWRVKV